MGVPNPPPDPAHVVQALVYTLLDVFDATRDLYETLKNKEKRDYENSLRSKGYPDSRRIEYVDDQFASDEAIVMDKAAVTRQLDIGLQDVGPQYAVGDVVSQVGIQSQIIALQNAVITTFLYGPTSSDPISNHLSTLLAASRAAGTASVDILAAQHQRQLAILPPNPRSTKSPGARAGLQQPPPYPVTTAGTSTSASTAMIKSHIDDNAPTRTIITSRPKSRIDDDAPTRTILTSRPRSRIDDDAPTRTIVTGRPKSRIDDDAPTRTIATGRPRSRMDDDAPTRGILTGRPKANRTDTESTAFSGPTSYGAQSAPHTLYCLYALDLQRHPTQELASSITQTSTPFCPYCRLELHLSPGKSWEIYKDSQGGERCFRIGNRFVVKCHREGVDGGYSCVLCSNSGRGETVCGDVKALIRHVWMDHEAGELELEEDISEVVDKAERRRDSGASFGDSKRSSARRSVSLGPSRGKPRRRLEREVETWEMRAPRREIER